VEGWPKTEIELLSVILYTIAMTTHETTPGNKTKLGQLHSVLAQVLAEALQRGFHGAATVEIVVQDGTIQKIRRMVERVER
jgi:hypothetical protein